MEARVTPSRRASAPEALDADSPTRVEEEAEVRAKDSYYLPSCYHPNDVIFSNLGAFSATSL